MSEQQNDGNPPETTEETTQVGETGGDEQAAKIVKPAPENHEPEPGTKRFNQIYGQMKHYERQLAAHNEQIAKKDQDVEAMRAHQQQLTEAMNKLAAISLQNSKPDPIDDPEGYENWLTAKIKSEIAPVSAPPEPVKTVQKPEKPDMTRYTMMEGVVAETYPDYYDKIGVVNEALKTDPTLGDRIWNTSNPYLEAYKLSSEIAAEKAAQRSATISQVSVEGATTMTANPKKDSNLTEDQKRVADKLGVSHKDYQKQLEIIGSVRRK